MGLKTCLVIVVFLFVGAKVSWADVIEVAPGTGTVAAAAAKAKEGDTIRLAAGEYTGSVNLPAGVTMEGAGADDTTFTGDGYAVVNCQGPRVVISRLTIRPGEKTTRGVNTSSAVRIERCRFVGVKEAVAMMGAPLSDVVACEFIDCDIGVRAIGEACPTVMGCMFNGGRMGVFAMGGMPYIRNNIFVKQAAGIRMAPGAEQAIVRNNLFDDCKDAGIELIPKADMAVGPSIRNNIFQRCGAAVIGSTELLSKTSHCLVHAVAMPAFRDKSGAEVFKLGTRDLTEGDSGVQIGTKGQVTVDHAELLDGKGVHAGGDPPDRSPRIGIEAAWMLSGCGATATLPSVRFQAPLLVANAVAEEYQHIRSLGLEMVQQSAGMVAGRHTDTISCKNAEGPLTLKFDISRFWGEMSVTP